MRERRGPFALKRPDGSIVWETIAATKAEVWACAFTSMPDEFGLRYWKRWDASIAAARRLGYAFVPVEVIERKGAHMSEADRATLRHAAELLEACAAKLWALPDNAGLTLWDDAVATARALREMASAARG